MSSTATPSQASFATVPGEDGDHISYCRICEAICGLVVTVKDGQVTKIGPDRNNPHSRGHICVKGAAMADVANDPDRVIYPMKRVGGPGEFERVSWDEALDDIAFRLKAILAKYGTDAVALMYGNPGAFGLGGVLGPPAFAASIGSTKFYSVHTEDSATTLLAADMLYGASSFAYPDLPNCDHLIIFGSNPLVSHGSAIIAPRIREDLDAIDARGNVIVVDPRRTQTAERYTHQPIKPDSDVWLLAAMITVIAQEGLVATEFLHTSTTGSDELIASLSAVTPEIAAEHTGLSAEGIRTLALDFAKAERAAIMGRTGICRGTFPTLSNFLMHALNIVAGKFHKPGCSGFGHGAANAAKMFADAGMKGFVPKASRVSDLPAVAGALPSVTLYHDIMEPGEGQLKALIVQASNPVQSTPGGPRLPEAFEHLDLMVSLDIYASDTAQYADYILPCTTFVEREDIPLLFLGHMARPFVQHVAASTLPRGEARNEFDIWHALAARLGNTEPFATSPMDMADYAIQNGPEGAQAGPQSMNMTLDEIKRHPHGLELTNGRWEFELSEKILHDDGRIHLFNEIIASEIERLKSTPSKQSDALRLISSRNLKSINSWMHNVDRLVRSDTPRLLINPKDAEARSLSTGDMASIATDWGEIEGEVLVTDEMMPGVVTYPHGWGNTGGWIRAAAIPGANVNLIAPFGMDVVEQVSGMSFLDGFEVRVSRVASH